ncbi:hypothetical protein RFI_31525 [Reticulomyxa filosa]|uniref:Reverse transcriptase domain-containing protein n=1 Tax=Reticulomyxa filosa TaxID=46433 RepID=X6LYU3_RETFI|nr:hypothetical protein RFI_31525 [Reticulomyxa filosa]|eukprot:ETO05870.1 hypothetical protein RFI_31525 [Reticulomyxa filosa]
MEVLDIGMHMPNNKATFLDGLPNELNKIIAAFDIGQNNIELEQNICEEQGGFMRNKGVDDNIVIIRIVSYYMKIIKNNDMIFTLLDINKAFDSVWHDGLMHKLYNVGIKGKLFQMIHSMITQSNLMVTQGDWVFKPFQIKVCTVQGYSLSGPLFNMYINDPINDINNERTESTIYQEKMPTCLLYADDIIIMTVKMEDNNMILNLVQSYCNKWKISINTSKSYIAASKNIQSNKKKLDKVKTITNQSVTLGIIEGNLDTNTQMKFYKAAIRPVLEYGLMTLLLRKTMVAKMDSTQHQIISKILGTYVTSYKATVRVLTVIPPIQAKNKILLLSCWLEMMNKQSLAGRLTRAEHISIKELWMHTLVHSSFNVEALKILHEHGMLQHWQNPPTYLSKEQRKIIVRTNICRDSYEKDHKHSKGMKTLTSNGLSRNMEQEPETIQIISSCNKCEPKKFKTGKFKKNSPVKHVLYRCKTLMKERMMVIDEQQRNNQTATIQRILLVLPD